MAEPGAPAPDGDKVPPKPRSSRALAAAVALLLGVPLAGFALKAWGPLLFSPDEAPRPIVEVTGPRPAAVPAAAPAETRPSSLDLIRGDSPPAATAAPPAPPPRAAAPAAAPPAPPAVARQPPAPPPRRPYPKLKPNHGWQSWFARQPQQPTPDQEPDPNVQYQVPAPQDQPAPSPAPSAVSPPSAAAAPAAKPKPARQGYKPAPPVYTVTTQADEVSPGAGNGTVDVAASPADASAGTPVWSEHATVMNPPDRAPEPNPEKPRTADGACPRRGWWKSGYTGLCYYSHASCNASDYEHRGCVQPNP